MGGNAYLNRDAAVPPSVVKCDAHIILNNNGDIDSGINFAKNIYLLQ